MAIGCENRILLTGAGFTSNFGTPLSNQMWAWIFNYPLVQRDRAVRSQMMTDFDFENIYYKIMEGGFSAIEQATINEAVDAAYFRLDSIIRNFNNGKTVGISLDQVKTLIERFAPQEKQSFIFTVNQDLFLERTYTGRRLYLPGIAQNSSWFKGSFMQKMQYQHYVKLPSDEELEKDKKQELNQKEFNYIKLHGSYSWLDAQESEVMVIGRGKEVKIQNEPLLRWYMEIFENVILQPNRELLIIGYGFRDAHINSLLANAINNANLGLHVISPSQPSDFRSDLLDEKDSKPSGREIWTGLSGYYPFRLDEMYNLTDGVTRGGEKLYPG